MTSQDSITDRIKKLLRLAGCKAASTAEAAAALERAQDLMRRHNIEVAALDLDEPTEQLVNERIRVGQRVSFIKRRVADVLLNYFPVRVIWSRGDLVVVGYEHDVTFAGYVFHFLVGACQRAVREYSASEKKARRKISTNKTKNFIQGWMWGVTRNLKPPAETTEELTDSRTALVLAKRASRVQAHFDELYPKTITIREAKKPRENKSSSFIGFLAGRDTTINKPLNGSSREPLLLE